jgi:hypothetical protein
MPFLEPPHSPVKRFSGERHSLGLGFAFPAFRTHLVAYAGHSGDNPNDLTFQVRSISLRVHCPRHQDRSRMLPDQVLI